MTRIFMNMLPDGSKQDDVYRAGDVSVVVNLDRSLRVADSYSFFLYTSQLALMDMAVTGSETDNPVERFGRSLRLTLRCRGVWLPGDYFLLMRSGGDRVQRFDLQLAPDGIFRVTGQRLCASFSAEDMLSGRLCHQRAVWLRLSNRPGARQLKAWAMRRAMENELNTRREERVEAMTLCSNLLVSCRSELWRSFVAVELKHTAQMSGDLTTVDCATLFDPTRPDAYERLHALFSETDDRDTSFFDRAMHQPGRQVYAFYHIGALLDASGKNIMRAVMRQWPGGAHTAIFMGTQQEVDELLNQYPSLKSCFPPENRLAEEPYTRDEMVQLFFSEAGKARLMLSAEAREHVCRMLTDAYDRGLIAHWTMDDMHQYVRAQLLPAYLNGALQRVHDATLTDDLHLTTATDIDAAPMAGQRSGFDEAMEQLNAMVGLSGLKESLATLASRMRFYAERRQMGLRTHDGTTFHALFTGNPGTGKTTVARLLGRVYHSLGLLSKGEVVCVDRQRMIGQFIGETEQNMKAILQEARGNVLFVDEAYTLYNPGDERDYGRHALEALLDVLARPNPDMLIIFAGYEREMNQLMQANPGLRGRFPYLFRFPDYTAEELTLIACRLLKDEDYELTDGARQLLEQGIGEMVARRTDRFANARWASQLVHNGIVPAMADRVERQPHTLQRSSYQQVEEADVAEALSRFNSKTIEIRQRRTIGFCA